MTVEDLTKKLEEFDRQDEVFVRDCHSSDSPVRDVRIAVKAGKHVVILII